jgi:hypothetical protein
LNEDHEPPTTTEGKTMAARQSRASRAAAQAGQDVVVPINGGQGATGDNGKGGGTGKAPAKPAANSRKPAADKPAAPNHTVTVTEYPKTFYRPTIDGKPVYCEHDPFEADGKTPTSKYGHDSQKAALACARRHVTA